MIKLQGALIALAPAYCLILPDVFIQSQTLFLSYRKEQLEEAMHPEVKTLINCLVLCSAVSKMELKTLPPLKLVWVVTRGINHGTWHSRMNLYSFKQNLKLAHDQKKLLV